MTNLVQASRSARHDELHTFQGNTYWGQQVSSWPSWRPNEEGVFGADFVGRVNDAYKSNSVVFACELTRMALFSEARFQFQQMNRGRPGDLFGTADLSILEQPWPGGTTGDLLTRMLLDYDMAGSAFVARPFERPDRLMRMRPDWVTIVLGSRYEPDEANLAMDADVLGYIYHPGGLMSGNRTQDLLADEVAHFSGITPDPLAAYRGMSWLTPIIREVQADHAATMHKLMFFENGATPQIVVSMGPNVDPANLDQFVSRLDEEHQGWRNAYKTLYLGGGASVEVVGTDLKQLDFKVTQGAGETRIAAASGVHPVIAALSEGLAGSSLNDGNFKAACRLVADRTLRPLWRALAGSLASIIPPPPGTRLWYDARDISFLQEDEKDAAEILFIQAQTVRQWVDAGFQHDSAVAAAAAGDVTLLKKEPGAVSVQVQAGATVNGAGSNGNGSKPAALTVGD